MDDTQFLTIGWSSVYTDPVYTLLLDVKKKSIEFSFEMFLIFRGWFNL